MTEYTVKRLAKEIKRDLEAGDDVFVETDIWKALVYHQNEITAVALKHNLSLIAGVKQT